MGKLNPQPVGNLAEPGAHEDLAGLRQAVEPSGCKSWCLRFLLAGCLQPVVTIEECWATWMGIAGQFRCEWVLGRWQFRTIRSLLSTLLLFDAGRPKHRQHQLRAHADRVQHNPNHRTR
jgi:hypothetical protein